MLANPSRIARIPSGQPIQVAPLRLFIMPSTIHVTQEESPGSSAAMGLKAKKAMATAGKAVATPHRIVEKSTGTLNGRRRPLSRPATRADS